MTIDTYKWDDESDSEYEVSYHMSENDWPQAMLDELENANYHLMYGILEPLIKLVPTIHLLFQETGSEVLTREFEEAIERLEDLRDY